RSFRARPAGPFCANRARARPWEARWRVFQPVRSSSTARPRLRLRCPTPSCLRPPCLEGLAVDLAPVDTAVASHSTATDLVPSIQRHVGEISGAAAGTLAEGLRERSRGKLSLRTKMAGGDLIVELFKLRQMMVADWPFDRICRQHGAAVLR